MQQKTAPPQAAPAKPPKPVPPPEFREGNIATAGAAELVRILKDPASTEFQKAKACQRAGELGAREAVPALAALLDNEHLSTYARYGLEPIEDASAGDALRAALTRVKGTRLVGVVNSLGQRRDAAAGPALAKLIYGADPAVARAAAAALGSTGGAFAAKQLQAAAGNTKGELRAAVCDAALVCAGRMRDAGDREGALALYEFLASPAIPKPVRLGAMAALVREDTPAARSR